LIDQKNFDNDQTVVIVDQRAMINDPLSRLSQITSLKNVRVFIVSTTTDPVLRDHWLRLGISVVFDQPLVASDLLDALADNALRKTDDENFATTHWDDSYLRLKLNGHVLVAEDNGVNQLFITELLKLFGCTFDLATNGEEAVSAVTANEYSLVLMDCRMPEMDGFSATKEIRKWETAQSYKKRIPIVALTANALTGDREACLDAGMDDYVTKPIDPESLQVVLAKYLST
jgi:CheY-like chemotaxis protein